MKRIFNLWLILVLVTQISFGFGKNEATVDDPNMPIELIRCETVAELLPFLSDGNEIIRRLAVIRTSQFKTQDVAQTLITAFANEPRKIGMENNPIVKKEVIYALGNIRTDEAKVFLIKTLDRYIKEGPNAKRYAWEDKEYVDVIMTILCSLDKWEDDKIFNVFKDIYLDDTMYWLIRERAYQQYFAIEMQRAKIAKLEDRIKYILKNIKHKGSGSISDWVEGKNGVKTLDAVTNGALVTMLIQYGESTLPYIDLELKIIDSVKEKRRHEALFYIKEQILGIPGTVTY